MCVIFLSVARCWGVADDTVCDQEWGCEWDRQSLFRTCVLFVTRTDGRNGVGPPRSTCNFGGNIKLLIYNIYVIQQDTQCFMIEFIHNIWWLDMFRTSIVHPQESLQAVCCTFGIW